MAQASTPVVGWWGAITDSLTIELKDKPHPSATLSNHVRMMDKRAEPVAAYIREADHLFNDKFKILHDTKFKPHFSPLPSHFVRRGTNADANEDADDVASSSSLGEHTLVGSQGKSADASLSSSQGKNVDSFVTGSQGKGSPIDSTNLDKSIFSGLIQLNKRVNGDLKVSTESPSNTGLRENSPTIRIKSSNAELLGARRAVNYLRKKPKKHDSGQNVSPLGLNDIPEESVEEAKNCLAYRTKMAVENKSNDDIEKISTELMVGEDLTGETTQPTKRLLSVHNPNFSWRPAHVQLCYRQFLNSFPTPRPTNFVIKCNSITFEGSIPPEPLFMKMYLYDGSKEGRKISEDFHFHLNDNEVLEHCIPEQLRYTLPDTRAATFNITHPNSEIYLILFVYRVPVNVLEEGLKMYREGRSLSESSMKQFSLNMNKAGFFKQPFLFGYAPITEAIENATPLRDPNQRRSNNQLSPHETPNHPKDMDALMREVRERQSLVQTTMQGVAIKTGEQEISPMYIFEGSSGNTFNVNDFLKMKTGSLKTKLKTLKAKFAYDVSASYDRRTADIHCTSLFAVNPSIYVNDNLSESEGDMSSISTSPPSYEKKNASFYASTPNDDTINVNNESVFSDSPPIHGSHLRESASYNSTPFSSIDFDISTDFKRHSLKTTGHDLNFSVVTEFPSMKPSFPHLSFSHTLYVYPILASLKDLSGANNVIVEVVFRDEDSSFTNIEGIPCLATNRDQVLSTFDVTSVTLDEKNPQFTEEFKVELPVEPQPGHHLLFFIYQLEDPFEKKKEKKNKFPIAPKRKELGELDRFIVGYAYLDLVENLFTQQPESFDWEVIPGRCIVEGFKKVQVNKNLCMHYMHANSKLDLLGKAKLHVNTMLLSTIHPSDRVVHRFYYVLSDIERIHVQNLCVDEPMKDLLDILNGFRVIDFIVVLPYTQLLLNILFRTISTIDAFILEKIKPSTIKSKCFEAILIVMRGIYLVTGKDFSRQNKFLLSYAQFIFDDCNETFYSPKPAYTYLPTLLKEFLEDVKYANTDFGEAKVDTPNTSINSTPGKRKGNSFFSTKKSKVVSVTSSDQSEAISERDILRFSWLIFDLMIKSLTVSHGTVAEPAVDLSTTFVCDSPRTQQSTITKVNHGDGWKLNFEKQQDVYNSINELLEPYYQKVGKLIRNTKIQAQVGKHANRNMALFLRDLIPILTRDQSTQLIEKYLSFMNMNHDPNIILLKLEFVTIIMDYDFFISINLTHPTICQKCMEAILDVMSIKKQNISEKGISALLNHLTKIDFDDRHNQDDAAEKRNIIGKLYLPFVEKLLTGGNGNNGDLLCYYVRDRFHVDLMVCMLWMLNNCNQSTLLQWFHSLEKPVAFKIFKFLESCACTLHLQGDSDLCREAILINQHLMVLFTCPSALDPLIDQLREYMRQDDQEHQALEDEMESTLVPHPWVTLLMRAICRMWMNSIVSSDLYGSNSKNSHAGQLHVQLYFKAMCTFIEFYIDELVIKSIYRADTRIPLLHQKRVEAKWRWLLGVVLLNSELKLDAMNDPLKKVLTLLIQAYLQDDEYISRNQELAEAHVDGDVVYDDVAQVIRAATLKKLIERLIQHSNVKDVEGNKFKKTFLLTYLSFTSSRDLLSQLVKIYNHRVQENDSAEQLNSLNFIQEWVKKGFHDFDNFAISELVYFLSTLELNQMTRNKMRKPIMKQLLMVTTQHLTTGQQEQYEPSEVPKGFDLESMQTPIMPIKRWKSLKKKMQVNPFDYNFDILQWSPLEIARQLCLIESELFNAVEPKECFGLAWSKRNKEDLAPNMVAIVVRFEQMSLWIVNMIMAERDLKKRQNIMVKWIDIMRECLSLKNFVSVFQISAALNSAEIARLAKTKEAISDDGIQLCKRTLDFYSNNYKLLRAMIKDSAGSPVIPFIGVYQTDLTFAEEGNVDCLNHATVPDKMLINFTKRRLYSSSISDIQLLQQSCKYPKFRKIPFLQYILRDHITTGIIWSNERDRFSQSLLLEPRQ
ncbi:RasGEF [Acrasis kona]|uniref:RasGEF n=1 Tax=Acrasis kona TaxID=1008807 RepID=A0AAW2ZE51_9EUKA